MGDEMKSAVVLLSGGLDSATALAVARSEGFSCHALSIDYGQRHQAELAAARRVADHLGAIEHKTIRVDLTAIGGSALTDGAIAVPEAPAEGIPVTYVPARNTVFLALALGWAEVLDARDIFIGVNAVDYSGYPDCRPAFVDAFERLANLATKAGVEGRRFAHSRAPDRPEQGGDHPPGRGAWSRLRAHRLLLPGGCAAGVPAAFATPAACASKASERPECRIRRPIDNPSGVQKGRRFTYTSRSVRALSSVGRASDF